MTPNNTVLLFNLSLVQQRLATAILRADKSPLKVVLGAVRELQQAQKYVFIYTRCYLHYVIYTSIMVAMNLCCQY